MLDRPKSKNLSALRRTWQFLRPYKGKLVLAGIALTITSAATLSIGAGLKFLIDQGLSSGDLATLNVALAVMIIGFVLLGTGDTTLAPILLVIAYCALIPTAILVKGQPDNGSPADQVASKN